MKSIRKMRNWYALLFTVSAFLVVWLGIKFMLGAAIVFGVISAVSLLLLVKQSRLLYDAVLI